MKRFVLLILMLFVSAVHMAAGRDLLIAEVFYDTPLNE